MTLKKFFYAPPPLTLLTQLLDDCKIMNLEIVTQLPIHLSRYYVDDVVLTPLLDNCLLVNMEIVTHLHIQLSGNVFDDVVLTQLMDDCLIVNMEIVFLKLPPDCLVIILMMLI